MQTLRKMLDYNKRIVYDFVNFINKSNDKEEVATTVSNRK